MIEGNQARALIELGRFAEAKTLTEHALALADDSKDLRLAGRIAMYGAPAWCATAEIARCDSLLDSTRRHFRASLPAGHVGFAELDLAAAQLSLAQAQPAAAREQLQRAVAGFDAARESSPLRARALALLARTEAQLGNPAEAARHAELALQQARQGAKDFASSAWLGDALIAVAQVQQARGDTALAQASLRKAAAQLQGAVGDEAPAARQAKALLASR